MEDYWRESGKSGFKIWRYRLVKIENTRFDAETEDETDQEYGKTIRAKTNILRIVRDTSLAKEIKELYNFKCQVCGIVIEAPAGLYNEAAHIKPLGSPHNVPDSKSNIICLCPNHHVMFDNHVFSIADDFLLIGIDGKLFVHDKHRLDPDFIKYHREHYGK